MDIKRKIAMAVATLSVAFGVGHVMQGGLGGKPQRSASADTEPKAITPLAAGLTGSDPLPAPKPTATPLPDQAFAPTTPAPANPEPAVTAAEPATGTPHLPPAAQPQPETAPVAEAALSGDSINCPVTLELLSAPQAMLDITLLAPCRAGERVVLRHGGLTVTAKTSLQGSLFLQLPGMEQDGSVSVLFSDGFEATAALDLPDLPIYQRFAVQWLAEDTFQLHAFENGATFGTKGHVSAADPQRRLPNVPSSGGFMTILGDDSVDLPMLAEVYTYPINPDVKVDVTIETEVTEATCNRELLGELLLSNAGKVVTTDLTLATPTCDAIGDVLVLNNPLPDLTLASAR